MPIRSALLLTAGLSVAFYGIGRAHYGMQAQAADQVSPVIVDMSGDGIRLTTSGRGVRFDLYNTGTKIQVAWTERGSDDAFLAVDNNFNGRIDNGGELVGATVNGERGLSELAMNDGFVSRAERSPSAVNGFIDSQDFMYRTLILWTDKNHNGESEEDELQSFADAGFQSIRASYTLARARDSAGNVVEMKSTALRVNGKGVAMPRNVVAVTLATGP